VANLRGRTTGGTATILHPSSLTLA
jgi:hypothetical protein